MLGKRIRARLRVLGPIALLSVVLGSVVVPTASAAQSWEFNTAGNFEGWDGSSFQVTGLTVTGGSLQGTLAGADPQFYSPAISQAASNNIVKVRYENGTAGTQLTLRFQTAADPTWTGLKGASIPVAANAPFTEYTFDMSTVTTWTGTITRIRLEPDGASTGSAKFDYVRLEGAVPPPSAPPAPTGLTATAASPSQIDLAWNDVTGETSYIIERSLNGTTGWTVVGTNAANDTTFSDTGLAASTTYYYRVFAAN